MECRIHGSGANDDHRDGPTALVVGIFPTEGQHVQDGGDVWPRYNEPPFPNPPAGVLPPPVRAYWLQLLQQQQQSLIGRAVILLGLLRLFKGKERTAENENENDDDDDENDDDDDEEHQAAWALLPETQEAWKHIERHAPAKITYAVWVRLLAGVARHVVVWEQEHPWHHYARTVVPTLVAKDQRRRVLERFGFVDNLDHLLESALATSKALQDHPLVPQNVWYAAEWPQQPLQQQPQHSCMPNATLHLDSNSLLQISKLYQQETTREEENLSLCRIDPAASVEHRQQQLCLLTGHGCACLRCRYELHPSISSSNNNTTISDWMQLGRYLLGACQDYETAERVFDKVVNISPAPPGPPANFILLDAWHALGAIRLARKRFLAAQRLWLQAKGSSAAEQQQRHAGLELQWAKIQAYQYLTPPPPSERALPPSFHKVVDDKMFRTNDAVVDAAQCQQILQWCDGSSSADASWTQQRHYAVPTRDVPVHTVPALLAWFRDFFLPDTVSPLLAQQFLGGPTTSSLQQPQFYCHDAFVVQYEAGSSSHYLPWHTDESTHSFILALNDCHKDYDGGGTCVWLDNPAETTAKYKIVHLEKAGQLLTFRGDAVLHGGEPVTRGKRYILAAFLYLDNDDDDEAQPTTKATSRNKRNKKRCLDTMTGGGSSSSSDFCFAFEVGQQQDERAD